MPSGSQLLLLLLLLLFFLDLFRGLGIGLGQHRQGQSAVVLGIGVFRILLERLVVGVDGIGEPVLPVTGVAQVVEGVLADFVAIALFERFCGSVVLFSPVEGNALAVVVLEGLCRLLVAVLLEQAVAFLLGVFEPVGIARLGREQERQQ
ncbi:hypothetical protein BOW51_04360 [Solemya velesiana gill symbiont]|uniref:Uncharacterized protein n=1 Tax=Solemya velesiana gill symbiont TaxID=1918948 RepID=A0A1T2KWC8_9GAMM|nr:hypothetical protein BOW51_04360 [Solemya velesiana gill symbiont]